MSDMTLIRKGNRVRLVIGSQSCRVQLSGGPWIPGVLPELIKMRSWDGIFPVRIREQLSLIENHCNLQEDYFGPEYVRLTPGHPLYAKASEFV